MPTDNVKEAENALENSSNNMENEEFQSAEILLEITKAEYQNELGRTSVLDTKVGITLPIIATYFFLVLQFDSIKDIFSASPDTENIATLFFSVCGPLIYLATIICATIALIDLFRAITTQSYRTIEPRSFNDKEKMSYPKNVFSAIMVTFYIKALDHNRSINDARASMYKNGWSVALVSLFLFVCYVAFIH